MKKSIIAALLGLCSASALATDVFLPNQTLASVWVGNDNSIMVGFAQKPAGACEQSGKYHARVDGSFAGSNKIYSTLMAAKSMNKPVQAWISIIDGTDPDVGCASTSLAQLYAVSLD